MEATKLPHYLWCRHLCWGPLLWRSDTVLKFCHRYYITEVGVPLLSWLFMHKLYLLAPSEDDNSFLLLYHSWWKVFSTSIFIRRSISFSDPEKRTNLPWNNSKVHNCFFHVLCYARSQSRRKRPLAVSCLSFRPYAPTSACISAVPTGPISVNFDIGNFYEIPSLDKIKQKYRALY
jgi:hypothetical protein